MNRAMLVLGVVALLGAVRTFVRLPAQLNLVTVPTVAAIVLLGVTHLECAVPTKE